MAKIAADVGLTDGGLLYHFPSKKHLLLAVAEHRFSAIEQWWAGLGPDAGLDAVLDEGVHSTERLLAQPGLIELSVLMAAEAADASSPAYALFAQRYRAAAGSLSIRRVMIRTGVAVVHLAPPPGDARGDQPTMARRSRRSLLGRPATAGASRRAPCIPAREVALLPGVDCGGRVAQRLAGTTGGSGRSSRSRPKS